MGFIANPIDNRGDGQAMKEAPDGDITEPPEEVADHLLRAG